MSKKKKLKKLLPGAVEVTKDFYNLSEATGPVADRMRAVIDATMQPGEKEHLRARWDRLPDEARFVAVALTHLVCKTTGVHFISCPECRAAIMEAGAAAVERKVDTGSASAYLAVLKEVSALVHSTRKAAD